ncbi:MAG: hypothetical protein EZS28_008128 [Streblomastix strix]|uniref:Uncharacterized protein n=1 Tax=Streblomastix strix TaxID=222440 RepID=A0A5J4WNG1_9EUKA|nr:MAG: hypothetical protein EZS28_008128 [Streblomastix strix]
MSNNLVKSESSEPGLFVNSDTPKFSARTPITTTVEHQEPGDDYKKFLKSEHQLMLRDIEHQLTPRRADSERMQTIMAKMLDAVMGMHTSKIDF